MNIETVSKDYAVSGQIRPEEVRVVAQAGYKAIVCVRPDNESWGQPSFEDVARAANAFGIKAIHIPVSGVATANQLGQFKDVCKQLPKPVLGYCRSGARAVNLYESAKR